MEFVVLREHFASTEGDKEGYTLGQLFLNGQRIAHTLEDEDRLLELDPRGKVYGKTAIPRGRYKLVVDFSHRFQKPLPHIVDVPGYEGVRIHGGNHAEQLQGCIAVGLLPTKDGVSKCAPAVERVISLIQTAEDNGGQCYIEIK